MAEIIYNETKGKREHRQMLRSPYIDYFNRRLLITFQTFNNKSVFGAIASAECALNEPGNTVREAWMAEPEHVAGRKLGEFVGMPNHGFAI